MQLLEDIEYAMFSHHVKVQSPLELSPSGMYVCLHARTHMHVRTCMSHDLLQGGRCWVSTSTL